MSRRAKSLALEIVGWVLLVAGAAALVLPGPGLLMVFSGMILLAQRYAWANRWLRPVELRAMYGAAKSVQSWPRITLATGFALGLVATGLLWTFPPPTPSWWPLPAQWWLFGGVGVGVTVTASGVVALVLLGWSLRRFRGHPDAVAELHATLDRARLRSHPHGPAPADPGSNGLVKEQARRRANTPEVRDRGKAS